MVSGVQVLGDLTCLILPYLTQSPALLSRLPPALVSDLRPSEELFLSDPEPVFAHVLSGQLLICLGQSRLSLPLSQVSLLQNSLPGPSALPGSL